MKHLIPLLAFSFLVGCDGEKSNVAPSEGPVEEAFTESSYNKRIRLLFLLLILIVPCVAAQEKKSPLRTWASDIGTKIEAELVSLADGEVTLKTKTGRTLKVPLHKLSKADQEFAAAKSSPKEPTKDAVSVNPNLKYEVKGDEVTITGCDKKASGELIIAAIIEGKPVTSIEYEAFNNCTSLTSITIPDGVTSIRGGAFYRCTSLTSITIPDSVTSIGPAFGRCTSLTTIEVGAENVNYADVSGVLFNKEKTLLDTYPAGKTGANYVIADSVTSIGGSAFHECTSLTSIKIGNGVTSIGGSAFHECTSLTSITIPDGVTSIWRAAFAGCTSLTSVTIPDGVTSIEEWAFGGCKSLTSVTIPDGVTSIGEGAFASCRSLTSITIPDGVTNIGKKAFHDCGSLTSIKIGNGVTYIGVYPFYGCSTLTKIKVGAENVNYTDVEGVLFNKKKTLLHTYPAGKAGANYVIPNSVTRIWRFSFNGCSSLKSITIGNGVTSIGVWAFSGCTSLTDVSFLGDAPEIANDAFNESSPTIYRETDAKGWGDTLAGRTVKLITEKP